MTQGYENLWLSLSDRHPALASTPDDENVCSLRYRCSADMYVSFTFEPSRARCDVMPDKRQSAKDIF